MEIRRLCDFCEVSLEQVVEVARRGRHSFWMSERYATVMRRVFSVCASEKKLLTK